MAVVTPGTFSWPAARTALADEIAADPRGLGYAALGGDASDIAQRLNTSPEPIAGAAQEQVYRNRVASSDLMAGIVRDEFTVLGQGVRDYCAMLFSAQFVNTGDANIRTQMAGIFGAATASRANLVAAAQKQASRAEALWGDGFQVSDWQVYMALHPEAE